MQLETLGHACLLISDDRGNPVLLIDPWLIGSTYWRSWWLQNHPAADAIESLRNTAFIYLTHEHPDHFHPPSLRRIGRQPHCLVPRFPQKRMLEYLRSTGFRASELPPFDLVRLTPEVAVSSCPQWNDDSILLIETPHTVVVNLNDVKPFGRLYPRIRRYLKDRKKQVVVLSSHSAASIVHSFTRAGRPVSLLENATFVRHVLQACDVLGADVFIPFASQVVFSRDDSKWANDHRVLYEDLLRNWNSETRLLPPFSRLDLATLTHEFTPVRDYDTGGETKIQKIRAAQALDRDARLGDEQLQILGRRLNRFRWLLAVLFPAGIGFETGNEAVTYCPRSGCVVREPRPATITITTPAAPLNEAIEHDRISDLGIAMFTRIELARSGRPSFAYLLFSLLAFAESGHAEGVGAFRQWFGNAVRTTFLRRHIGVRSVPIEAIDGQNDARSNR